MIAKKEAEEEDEGKDRETQIEEEDEIEKGNQATHGNTIMGGKRPQPEANKEIIDTRPDQAQHQVLQGCAPPPAKK